LTGAPARNFVIWSRSLCGLIWIRSKRRWRCNAPRCRRGGLVGGNPRFARAPGRLCLKVLRVRPSTGIPNRHRGRRRSETARPGSGSPKTSWFGDRGAAVLDRVRPRPGRAPKRDLAPATAPLSLLELPRDRVAEFSQCCSRLCLIFALPTWTAISLDASSSVAARRWSLRLAYPRFLTFADQREATRTTLT
jgi:hypothetical protein